MSNTTSKQQETKHLEGVMVEEHCYDDDNDDADKDGDSDSSVMNNEDNTASVSAAVGSPDAEAAATSSAVVSVAAAGLGSDGGSRGSDTNNDVKDDTGPDTSPSLASSPPPMSLKNTKSSGVVALTAREILKMTANTGNGQDDEDDDDDDEQDVWEEEDARPIADEKGNERQRSRMARSSSSSASLGKDVVEVTDAATAVWTRQTEQQPQRDGCDGNKNDNNSKKSEAIPPTLNLNDTFVPTVQPGAVRVSVSSSSFARATLGSRSEGVRRRQDYNENEDETSFSSSSSMHDTDNDATMAVAHPIMATAISQEQLVEELRREMINNTVTAEQVVSIPSIVMPGMNGNVEYEEVDYPCGDGGSFSQRTSTSWSDGDGNRLSINSQRKQNPKAMDRTDSGGGGGGDGGGEARGILVSKREKTYVLLIAGCLCLVLVALIITIVELTTDGFLRHGGSDSDDDLNPFEFPLQEYLSQLLAEKLPNDGPISVEGSPQRRAMQYVLSHVQKFTLPLSRDEEDLAEATFALATLYFATSSSSSWENATTTPVNVTTAYDIDDVTSSWIRTDNWLDFNISICSWYGVECKTSKNDDIPPSEDDDGVLEDKVATGDGSRHYRLLRRKYAQGSGHGRRDEEVEDDLGNGPRGPLKILSLVLPENGLQGTIPEELRLLRYLKTLNISHNPALIGTLPPDIHRMRDMEQFDVSYTSLSGTLPTSLSSWDRIQHMALESTQILGQIPDPFCDMIELRQFVYPVQFSADCLDQVDCLCCTKCCGSVDENVSENAVYTSCVNQTESANGDSDGASNNMNN